MNKVQKVALISVPQDGRMWFAHWRSSDMREALHWKKIKQSLAEAELTQIDGSERQADIEWDCPDNRLALHVLHGYCSTTDPETLRQEFGKILGQSGFQIAAEASHVYPNETAPDGVTFSYLLRDGGFQGVSRQILLAESHIAVGPHFSVHTYPTEEGAGVTTFSLITWKRAKFQDFQSLLYQRGVSYGVVASGECSVPQNDQACGTLVCCVGPKFQGFMKSFLSGHDADNFPVIIQGEDISPPRGLVRAITLEAYA
ncbi:MAG: hypothetical protein ABI747_03880 [Candidatus Moraniibacteriota bacterium]